MRSFRLIAAVGLEVGGWSAEAAQFVSSLARARARSVPDDMQASCAAACRAR